MEQKTRDPKKDFKIFAILNSLKWDFDKATLNKNINLLTEVLSLMGANNPLRKGLKRNRTSLTCIKSAFDRYDPQILERDYNIIKEEVYKAFQDFQLNTGITKLPEKILKELNGEVEEEIKKEEKPQKLDSFAALGAWKEHVKKKKEEREKAKEKAKLEKEVLEKAKEKTAKMPLLKTSRTIYEDAMKTMDKGIAFLRSPLVVNGYVENSAMFEYLGVVIAHTKFGFTWSNQLIAIVKKDPRNTKERVLQVAEEKFNVKYQILYSPVQHPDFEGYLFYWLFASEFLAHAGIFTVNHYYLPLEYPDIKRKKPLLTSKEMEEARKKMLKFKKDKQMPQLDQCKSLVDFRIYLQMVYVGQPLTKEVIAQARADLEAWMQMMDIKEQLVLEVDYKRNLLTLTRKD